MRKLLYLCLILSLSGCINYVPIDTVKDIVVEREKMDIPLRIQEYGHDTGVIDIVIEDIVITNNRSPYEGYLMTKWTLEGERYSIEKWKYIPFHEERTVYIPLHNIKVKPAFNYAVWYSDWAGAAFSIR